MLTIGSGWIGCAATLTLPCPGPRFVNDSLSFPSRTSQQDTALALAQRPDCDALRVERPDQDTGRMAFAAEQHQARTLALATRSRGGPLATRSRGGVRAVPLPNAKLERLAATAAAGESRTGGIVPRYYNLFTLGKVHHRLLQLSAWPLAREPGRAPGLFCQTRYLAECRTRGTLASVLALRPRLERRGAHFSVHSAVAGVARGRALRLRSGCAYRIARRSLISKRAKLRSALSRPFLCYIQTSVVSG
jgi:hypothetical protein